MKSTLAAVKRQRFPSQASQRVRGLFILSLGSLGIEPSGYCDQSWQNVGTIGEISKVFGNLLRVYFVCIWQNFERTFQFFATPPNGQILNK